MALQPGVAHHLASKPMGFRMIFWLWSIWYCVSSSVGALAGSLYMLLSTDHACCKAISLILRIIWLSFRHRVLSRLWLLPTPSLTAVFARFAWVYPEYMATGRVCMVAPVSSSLVSYQMRTTFAYRAIDHVAKWQHIGDHNGITITVITGFYEEPCLLQSHM